MGGAKLQASLYKHLLREVAVGGGRHTLEERAENGVKTQHVTPSFLVDL